MRNDLQVLREAVDNFKADTNRYPLKVDDLTSFEAPASGYDREGEIQDLKARRYKGPYLDRVPASAITGESYLIVLPPEKKKYVHHPHGTALDGSDYYEW